MQLSRSKHATVPGGPRALHTIHRSGRFDLIEVHPKQGVHVVRPDSDRQRVPSLHEVARRTLLARRKPAARVAEDAGERDRTNWLVWSQTEKRSTICTMTGSLTVPEMPALDDSQLIYISLGLEGRVGTLRTALQWGFNGSNGGPQWGFACWHEDLTGDKAIVMSCLEPVETGDTLDVEIARKEIAGHTVWQCRANARGTGAEATVNIIGAIEPSSCILGLEMYNADLNDPTQYPGSKTRFTKPVLHSESTELRPRWKSGSHFPDGVPPDPERPHLGVKERKKEIVLQY